MEFCPKCGAVLIQKTKKLGCPRCNYLSKGKASIKTSEAVNERKDTIVLEENFDVRPIMVEQCKKCKNNKAYFWAIQQRSSDEAETKFFQCTKCGDTHKTNR